MIAQRLFILFIISAVMMLSGCQLIPTPQVDELLEIFIEGLSTREYESLYHEYNTTVSQDAFTAGIDELAERFDGTLQDYRKIRVRTQREPDTPSDHNETIHTYQCTTTSGTYIATIITQKTEEGHLLFTGFNLIDESYASSKYHLWGQHPWQIPVLIYSAVSLGIVLLAIIQCIRKPFRWKIIWCLLLLIQSGIVITSTEAAHHTGIHVVYYGISLYRIASHDIYQLTLLIPFTAIGFLIFQKTLLKLFHQRDVSKGEILIGEAIRHASHHLEEAPVTVQSDNEKTASELSIVDETSHTNPDLDSSSVQDSIDESQ